MIIIESMMNFYDYHSFCITMQFHEIHKKYHRIIEKSGSGMARIYIIGIIYIIMFLNIPAVRDNTAAQLQIYKPKAEDQIRQWKDKYAPAVINIANLLKKQTTINGKIVDTALNNNPVDTTNTWGLHHKNSLTADQIDNILRGYGSPATGLGATVTKYAEENNIDNAYWLYMYIHESTAGTKGIAIQTKSTGNIKCADTNCIDGFQAYPTWEAGAKDHIRLLAYYRDTLGDKDIFAALDRWAPATENNQAKDCDVQQRIGKELSYPCGLMVNVTKWRTLNEQQPTVITSIETSANITAPALSTLPANKEVKSSTLSLAGSCLSDTVPNALLPSKGLQSFSIAPGKDWSFNEHWTIINENDHICGNVAYGGICDMASQYQMVAKQLGLERTYPRHPGGLNNIPYDDTVVIWSKGMRGGQDLIITNKTNRTAIFKATVENEVFTVFGWLE